MTDMLLGGVPPHNLEAEMATHGSMLCDASARVLCRQHVGPESFYRADHRAICEAVLKLDDGNSPIDLPLLKEALAAAGRGDVTDSYIIDLYDSFAQTANAEYYARIVRDKARLRGIIQDAAEAMRRAYATGASPGDVADFLESRIMADSLATAEGAASFPTIIKQVTAVLKSAGAIPWGLASGFTDIDKWLHGFRPKTLTLVAARPGVGKSALCHNIIDSLCTRGEPVGLFTLEMSAEEVALRLLAGRSRVGLWQTQRGRVSNCDLEKIMYAADAMVSMPLYI